MSRGLYDRYPITIHRPGQFLAALAITVAATSGCNTTTPEHLDFDETATLPTIATPTTETSLPPQNEEIKESTNLQVTELAARISQVAVPAADIKVRSVPDAEGVVVTKFVPDERTGDLTRIRVKAAYKDAERGQERAVSVVTLFYDKVEGVDSEVAYGADYSVKFVSRPDDNWRVIVSIGDFEIKHTTEPTGTAPLLDIPLTDEELNERFTEFSAALDTIRDTPGVNL